MDEDSSDAGAPTSPRQRHERPLRALAAAGSADSGIDGGDGARAQPAVAAAAPPDGFAGMMDRELAASWRMLGCEDEAPSQKLPMPQQQAAGANGRWRQAVLACLLLGVLPILVGVLSMAFVEHAGGGTPGAPAGARRSR